MLFPRSLLSSRLVPANQSLSGLPSLHSAAPAADNSNLSRGLEASMAEMSLSVLYLHNLHHRAAVNRPTLGQISGYAFQPAGGSGGSGDDRGERAPLLSDTALS